MRLQINSSKLSKAINVVAPVVKDKSPMPILANLLFEVSKSQIKITASNGEIRTSVSVELVSEKQFSFCVSKNLLGNILSSLPNVDIALEIHKNELTLTSNLGIYVLPIEDSKLFPEKGDLKELNSFKVDAELFLDGLKKAIPFVDTFTANIDRVLIKSEKNKLNIAGISNICFYEKEFDYNGDDIEVVLTTSSAKFLVDTFDVDDDLSINYNDTFFCVYFDGVEVEITQLAVQFPNYRKILNSLKKEKSLTFDLTTLSDSVKRISAISDKDNNSLVMDLENNVAKLSYENNFLNHRVKEEIACEYTDEPIRIGLNIKNLKQILSTVSEVKIFVTTPTLPILFEEENTRILLSPMKI